MDPESLCAASAARQFGLITWSQARGNGFSARQIHVRVKRGLWLRYLPGVYRVAGSSTSLHQYLMGACLWGGPVTLVSHRAAAALFSLQGIPAGTVEVVTTTRKRSPTPRIKLHYTRDLAGLDQAIHQGLPVTSVARTIVDLASVTAPKVLERAFNHALRFGMTSAEEVGARLDAVGSNGRRGTRELQRLLMNREILHEGSASDLEDDFISFVRWAGLPMPVGQFSIFDDKGRFVMRCDFAYPTHKVAIEIDSRSYHSDAGDRARDHLKRRTATAQGWIVVPVGRRDLGPDRRKLATDLRTIVNEADIRARRVSDSRQSF